MNASDSSQVKDDVGPMAFRNFAHPTRIPDVSCKVTNPCKCLPFSQKTMGIPVVLRFRAYVYSKHFPAVASQSGTQVTPDEPDRSRYQGTHVDINVTFSFLPVHFLQ